MKRLAKHLISVATVATALSTLFTGSLSACDFCSCVSGINPFYNGSNRISLVALYQRSHHGGSTAGSALKPAGPLAGAYMINHGGGHDGIDTVIVPTTEQRLTLELSYRHHVADRFIVTAMLPVATTRIEGAGTTTIDGLGDATLIGHYVLDDLFSDRTPATLLLGGGVELPTGADDKRDTEGRLLAAHMQPGSGSVDLVADALLSVPIDLWTFTFDAYGKVNTANGRDVRVGNSLSLTAVVSRDVIRDNPSNVGLIGTTGFRGEIAGADRVSGEIDPASGSETLWWNVGGQLVLGSVKADAAVLLPLFQRREEGGANEGPRLAMGIRYEL